MLQTLDGVVVQINMRDLDLIEVQTFRIHSKTVILRRYFNLLSRNIENGMISAMVAEFQLECPAAKRQSKNLMTETNPKERFFSE